MCECAKFQAKQTTLTFSVQICPKVDLGLAIRNFKIISPDSESASLRFCVNQFSDKTNNFEILDPNFLYSELWGRNIKNRSLDLVGMNTSNIPNVPIFSQNG